MANPVLKLIRGLFGGAEPEVQVSASPSSPTYEELGMSPDSVLNFDAQSFMSSDRKKELDYRSRFFRCEQHDWKTFDFDGRLQQDGPAWNRQRVWGSTQAAFFVPFDQRRPSVPYRLPRKIVQDFTDFVFGHGQFPTIQVHGDPDREAWVNAIAEEAQLRVFMPIARNRGGSVGTVGISWRFQEGKPRVQVHSGQYLFVHEWRDREMNLVHHVSEIYQYADTVKDAKGKLERKWFWHRRDWTPVADVKFKPVEVKKDNPEWEIDEESTFIHGDGFAHFVWIANLPPDDETSIDGQPDYVGLYEPFGATDVINSVVFSGAKKNLDPTLVLVTPNEVGTIKKGSDNAITPGAGGSASYLELSGSSIDAGLRLVKEFRTQILEVAQCVSPDPNTVAAQGTSSVALKMMYRPMLSRCDIFRTQYGNALAELLMQMVWSAERFEQTRIPVFDESIGEEVEVEEQVILEPRTVQEDELDEVTGQPTGRKVDVQRDHFVGTSGRVKLVWPDYFEPSSDDTQKEGAALTQANGGKPVLSQRTTVERMARAINVDAAEEQRRIDEEAKSSAASQAAMFPSPSDVV